MDHHMISYADFLLIIATYTMIFFAIDDRSAKIIFWLVIVIQLNNNPLEMDKNYLIKREFFVLSKDG